MGQKHSSSGKKIEETSFCCICGKSFLLRDLFPAELVQGSVLATIQKTNPEWSGSGYICTSDLARFRSAHVQEILEREIGDVTELEHTVLESLKAHELVSEESLRDSESDTFGEKLADKVAEVGGSWTFIMSFALVLVIWITINTIHLFENPFDPYPYILLNLCLFCLAAVQAPIIMMSQNRQEQKDRERAKSDYKVNLKAELEIRHLHEKIDHLLVEQWKRLADIQEQQMAILESLAGRRDK